MKSTTGQDNATLWGRESAELLRSLLCLKTQREARSFIRDLMTEDEIRMVVARWQVARMLASGRTYHAIEQKTGLSSRTIARISLWLREGEGGYRLLLCRRKKKK